MAIHLLNRDSYLYRLDRSGVLPNAVEDSQDSGVEETGKRGLHSAQRVSANIIVEHAWEVAGSGNRETSLLLR